MASTSNVVVNSESNGNDFTYVDSDEGQEEEVEWIDNTYFPVGHVLE